MRDKLGRELEAASTESLVRFHLNSNLKMAAAVRDPYKLEVLAWANEHVTLHVQPVRTVACAA
jgi:hypothetical protein